MPGGSRGVQEAQKQEKAVVRAGGHSQARQVGTDQTGVLLTFISAARLRTTLRRMRSADLQEHPGCIRAAFDF